jgi:hypothetical protein
VTSSASDHWLKSPIKLASFNRKNLPVESKLSFSRTLDSSFRFAKHFDQVIWQEDVEKRLKWGMQKAIKLGVLTKGETIIAVQGWRGGLGHTNT